MKHKITIVLLFLSFVFQAQQKELTLKDALIYALENKADAKKAKWNVENSNHVIAEIRSRALPQVNVTSGVNYNPILQQSALPGEFFGQPGSLVLVPFGQKWNSSAVVGFSQNLFDQSVFTGLKAARTTKEFYIINQQLTEEQIIEKVSGSYYQVYVYKQKLTVAENILESTKKIKNIIQGQFENGLAKKIDLERMTVNVSNLEAARQQVQNYLQLQENTLKYFMGMPMEETIRLPEINFELSSEVFTGTVDVTNRTEMALLKKQEQLYQFQRKSYLAEYYPTLSLTANYGYQGIGKEFPWGAKPADGVYWTDFSAIGVNLRIPLFNGFATRSRVRQAEINLKKTEEDLKETALALNYGFENAKTQLNNSFINIRTQKENKNLAQDVLNNTKNNYVNGLATLTDLLDAENALINAQNNYITAMLEYKMAEIQIIKSKGELKLLTQ